MDSCGSDNPGACSADVSDLMQTRVKVGNPASKDMQGRTDAETWKLVFRQTVPFAWFNDNRLSHNEPSSDNFAALDTLDNYRDVDGNLYFKLLYPNDGGEDTANKWRQSSNPTKGPVTGYRPVSITHNTFHWGGLEKNFGARCLLDGSVGNPSWWFAIGVKAPLFGGKYPGPGTLVDKIELWVCDKCTPPSVQFNSMFSSNMVLPRSPLKARIWGDAVASATVIVKLSNAKGKVVSESRVRADSNGEWQVDLPPQGAGRGFKLFVTNAATKETKNLTNVAIGDLYLCSGQSNMEFGLHWDLDGKNAIANSDNPDIRIADVAKFRTGTPQKEATSPTIDRWRVSGPAAMYQGDGYGYPSAVCYSFAKHLYAQLTSAKKSVPIGIITSAWGGQMIESFSTHAALHDKTCGGTNATWKAFHKTFHTVSDIYNGMIHPLKGFRFAGTLWYQGEANSGLPDAYACRLPSLITDWRRLFDSPTMMFLYVELSAWDSSVNWVKMRQKMKEYSTTLPKVGYATAIDLGQRDPAPYGTIHPQRKHEIGRRLASLAMNMQYGSASIRVVGPVPDSTPSRLGNKVVITFANESSLHTHGTAECRSCCDTKSPFHSIAADGSSQQLPASAFSISGNTVVLSHASLSSAVKLAYAYQNYPECAVYNGVGGPDNHTGFAAAPFVLDLSADDRNALPGDNDGAPKSGWVLVFRQTASDLWPNTNPPTWSRNSNDPKNSNYAILDQLESFRGADGKFTLKLQWPNDEGGGDSDELQIWKQTTNPVTSTTGGVKGYEAMSVAFTSGFWGGLERNMGGQSLLDGSVRGASWFYAVGCHRMWGGGYPGAHGRRPVMDKVELYAYQPWKLVFRQTLPFLWPTNTWSLNANDPSKDNYADMLALEKYRDIQGKLTFKLQWPGNPGSSRPQVWKQTTNPAKAAAGGVEGYSAVNVSYIRWGWHGIERNMKGHSLMDGSVKGLWNPQWFYALGSRYLWKGGYPGAGVKVSKVELYVANHCGPDQGDCES